MIRSTKTKRPARRFHAAPQLCRELAPYWRALPRGARLVEPWPHASTQLARLSLRLGLPRTTPRRLRHTFFTWFVAANGFSAELLELGGWRDLTIPSKVYAHASPKRLRAQIERTHRLVVERRGAQKISRKREPEPDAVATVANDVGAVEAATSTAPGPAHEAMPPVRRMEERARSSDAAILAASEVSRSVGPAGFEPAAYGLKVPFCPVSDLPGGVGSQGESHANETGETTARAAAVAAQNR